MKKNIWIGF